ncbi:MotA/TolQ/ExbB proton channel family protein [Kiloniella majae]|uniref:MotA/TolQ/ExbB proton channel family protein n=1 Tax=Kiloniella majae TaxID=1938558 RepID=UPI000A279617|nr:MotA/TolQ/ExbB proton channel family protein [Kiloniella majae]
MLQDTETEALTSLLEVIDAAGAVGWVLAGMALSAAVVIFYKVVVFWRSGLWQTKVLRQARVKLRQGEIVEAVHMLDSLRHPAVQLVTLGVDRARTIGLDDKNLEIEMEQLSLGVLERLKSGIRYIGAVAALSPLMGLLGTVLGMIDAFRQMEAAGNQVDPSILSGGIWLALLTTAIGLVVAIPATAAQIWLNSVIQKTTRRLEETGTAVLTGLHIHTLKARSMNDAVNFAAE